MPRTFLALLSTLCLLLPMWPVASAPKPKPAPKKNSPPSAAEIQAARANLRRAQSNTTLNAAQSNYDQGKYREAIAIYDKYIQGHPTDATAYAGRGNARFAIGDKQGALGDFDRALQLEPKLVPVLRNRAIAKANMGDRPGAIADLRKAVQLQPQDAELHYLLGLGLYGEGDRPAARQSLQKALALYQAQGNTAKVQRINSLLRKIPA